MISSKIVKNIWSKTYQTKKISSNSAKYKSIKQSGLYKFFIVILRISFFLSCLERHSVFVLLIHKTVSFYLFCNPTHNYIFCGSGQFATRKSRSRLVHYKTHSCIRDEYCNLMFYVFINLYDIACVQGMLLQNSHFYILPRR